MPTESHLHQNNVESKDSKERPALRGEIREEKRDPGLGNMPPQGGAVRTLGHEPARPLGSSTSPYRLSRFPVTIVRGRS